MSDFYDYDGEPITLRQWQRLFSSGRHFGDTIVGDARVSTVWLGLDQSWGQGPPMIFESMIFGGPMDEYMQRYATAEEASTGHEFLVMMLRAQLAPARRKQLIHKGGKP